MHLGELYAPDIVSAALHLERLDALRAQGAVVELERPASGRRTFIALTDAAVRALALHPALSARFGTGVVDDGAAAEDGVPFRSVNTSDGADHAVLRARLERFASVSGIADAARAACRAFLAAQSGALDVTALAAHVQLAVMASRFEGLPRAVIEQGAASAHRAAFAWHDHFGAAKDRGDLRGVSAGGAPSAHDVAAYFRGIDNDIIAALADVAAHGEDLWLVRFAFVTAFVTTELAVTSMLAHLHDAALVERLRADPASRARFVQESLRVQAPVARFGRVARDDVDVDLGDGSAARVPSGARVLLSFAAACHDPALYPRPRALDLDRAAPASTTLAFGAGPHACLGAGVALAVMRALLEELLPLAPFDVVTREVLLSAVNRGLRRLVITPRAP